MESPGPRSAWERRNGLFAPVDDLNWENFDNPEPSGQQLAVSAEDLANLFEHGGKTWSKSEAVKKLQDKTGASRSACYSALHRKGRFSQFLVETEGVLSWRQV